MSDNKNVRLNKLVKEFNVSIDRIYAFLEAKGIEDLNPNTKVSHEVYMNLLGEFDSEKKAKLSAELLAKEKELAKAEEIIKQQESEEKAKIEIEKAADLAKQEKLVESAEDEVIKVKTQKKELKVLEKFEVETKKPTPLKIEVPIVKESSNSEEKAEEPNKEDEILIRI